MARGNDYIRHLAEVQLQHVPNGVAIPKYCYRSASRAKWFAKGVESQMAGNDMKDIDELSQNEGVEAGRSYRMGYEAAADWQRRPRTERSKNSAEIFQ